jgi:hypothetical protein
MTRRRTLSVAAGAVILIAMAVLAIRFAAGRGAPAASSPTAATDARAPGGVRIRVEVLNASNVQGLARRATRHLRDRGFDVVYFGTEREKRDSTIVLDRAGQAEWARLVAAALGGVPTDSQPGSSRSLDVTVLLGPDWIPPSEPFHP